MLRNTAAFVMILLLRTSIGIAVITFWRIIAVSINAMKIQIITVAITHATSIFLREYFAGAVVNMRSSEQQFMPA